MHNSPNCLGADLYQMLGVRRWSERGNHPARAIGGWVYVMKHDDWFNNEWLWSVNHQSASGDTGWQSDPIGSRAVAEETAILLAAFCGAEVVRS
jgi:hypothetical protein